jgi:hypothetical protein
MFQNEFEFANTITTILDDEAVFEDIKITIDAENVYITQWNEFEHRDDIIIMSYKMFEELQIALHHPEGMFTTLKK